MTNLTAIETTETAAPVTIAIGEGPVTPDHDGRSRGWRCSLVINPETRTVTLDAGIGSGTPMNVWHNRALSLSLNVAADGEAVTELLEGEEAQELLAAICDSYEGTRWDGHNNVGCWAADEDDATMPAHVHWTTRLEAMLEDVSCYGSASDWLGGAWSECRDEVAKVIAGAATDKAEAEAIDSLIERWIDDARSNASLLLSESDVRRSVESMIEQLTEEDDDDLWLVEGGEATRLSECDEAKAVADAASLGETWWVVDALNATLAHRAARALRAAGVGAARDEVKRLDGKYTYDGAILTNLAASVR